MSNRVLCFDIIFQSSLPAKGATAELMAVLKPLRISILAPREGSDMRMGTHETRSGDISILAPREGSDRGKPGVAPIHCKFQSSLPAKGATIMPVDCYKATSISILAPREGSDICVGKHRSVVFHFNPRSPRRERPWRRSISSRHSHFNPRSPRRERRNAPQRFAQRIKFQSSLPAKGATYAGLSFLVAIYISILAPREGSDLPLRVNNEPLRAFQSSLPAKGATAILYKIICIFLYKINIYAPKCKNKKKRPLNRL